MNDLEITTLRLDQPGLRAALGDLESAIMELVWQRPEGEGVTVRDIWDELYPTRQIMYTTVMNTMTRLARKGLLSAERKEPAFVYRAALSREAFVDRFVGGVLERLLVNFGGVTVERLRRADDPSTGERIAQLLDRVEQKRANESTD